MGNNKAARSKLERAAFVMLQVPRSPRFISIGADIVLRLYRNAINKP